MIRYDTDGLPEGRPCDPEMEVSPRETRRMLDEGEDVLLLDCRTPGEWETARIGGATLVPLQELASRLEELRPHEDREVIVYCHHGRRSLVAASLLRREGFARARSMAGGIDGWSAAIDSSVPRY